MIKATPPTAPCACRRRCLRPNIRRIQDSTSCGRAAGKQALPVTRSEARARLTEIDDAIAAIRTQIAATDLQRQAQPKADRPAAGSIAPRPRCDICSASARSCSMHMACAAEPRARTRLKDCLIAVLRERLRR